jgi:hypothetical protein
MNWCWLFGHVYYVDRELSKICRVVHCGKCPKRWLMNDSYQAFIELDDDGKKMVDVLYGVKL